MENYLCPCGLFCGHSSVRVPHKYLSPPLLYKVWQTKGERRYCWSELRHRVTVKSSNGGLCCFIVFWHYLYFISPKLRPLPMPTAAETLCTSEHHHISCWGKFFTPSTLRQDLSWPVTPPYHSPNPVSSKPLASCPCFTPTVVSYPRLCSVSQPWSFLVSLCRALWPRPQVSQLWLPNPVSLSSLPVSKSPPQFPCLVTLLPHLWAG